MEESGRGLILGNIPVFVCNDWKGTRIFSQYVWSPGWNLNPGPNVFWAGVLTTRLVTFGHCRYIAVALYINNNFYYLKLQCDYLNIISFSVKSLIFEKRQPSVRVLYLGISLFYVPLICLTIIDLWKVGNSYEQIDKRIHAFFWFVKYVKYTWSK